MICGEFCKDDNSQYCESHIKRHSIKNTENSNDYVLRSFKLRYYPTAKQKGQLVDYFGCSRKSYNLCVENDENLPFDELRNKYVTELPKQTEYKYLEKTPKEIRAFAVKEYITGKENSQEVYEKRIERQEFCIKKYPKYKVKTIKKNQYLNIERKEEFKV